MTTLAGAGIEPLEEWIGRTKSVEDQITLPALRRIAALLDQPADRFVQGAPLPPHWYTLFFSEIAPHSRLGPDGHPAKGEFLPPVPLPRRMFVGRRVQFTGPLRVGDSAIKTSEIVSITPKTGSSGEMVFVTVRHTFAVDGRVAVIEEQDVVYRGAVVPGGKSTIRAPAPAPPEPVWSETVAIDPVMGFRFSAITFNGHRIHYDADYARGEEGYPACVVNGALTILLVTEAASRQTSSRLAVLTARMVRPLFVGDRVTIAGHAERDGRMAAWAADSAGALAASVDLQVAQ